MAHRQTTRQQRAGRRVPAKAPPVKKTLSASEVRKLPKQERDAYLRKAAILAEPEYRSNPVLTDFEAFEEEIGFLADAGDYEVKS